MNDKRLEQIKDKNKNNQITKTMNNNLNLVEILENCPEGTILYSPIFGDVEFLGISKYEDTKYPIAVKLSDNKTDAFTKDGKLFTEYNGECMLFPSNDQRDWSKFKVKKPKFDPKTLQPFDKVLARRDSGNYNVWFPDFVSDPPNNDNNKTLCMCVGDDIAMVIPYNNDTKHLIGTTDEAPEFYKYWED